MTLARHGRHLTDDRPMRGHAGFRCVEVHDVQPACTGVDERPGRRHGVVRERRLTSEVALDEADDTPSAQVDGGQQIEGCHGSHWMLLC